MYSLIDEYKKLVYEFNGKKVRVVINKLKPISQIELVEAETGMPYAIATSNIPELKM